jgi:hypothetical protein
MNVRAPIILLCLTFVDPLVFAQSPCPDCFKAAEEAMKSCLANAISVDDQTACKDGRDGELKACNDGECRIEREKREQSTDAPPQGP